SHTPSGASAPAQAALSRRSSASKKRSVSATSSAWTEAVSSMGFLRVGWWAGGEYRILPQLTPLHSLIDLASSPRAIPKEPPMSQPVHRFVDASGASPRKQDKWPSIVVPREAIETEVQRLADAPRPANGRRASAIVHPEARAPGLGFAPGIDVT